MASNAAKTNSTKFRKRVRNSLTITISGYKTPTFYVDAARLMISYADTMIPCGYYSYPMRILHLRHPMWISSSYGDAMGLATDILGGCSSDKHRHHPIMSRKLRHLGFGRLRPEDESVVALSSSSLYLRSGLRGEG